MPEGLFVSWEGACEFIHEVCRTPGHVAPVRLEDLGRTGAIDVTW